MTARKTVFDRSKSTNLEAGWKNQKPDFSRRPLSYQSPKELGHEKSAKLTFDDKIEAEKKQASW